ncbi:MAG TPA: amino acid ABC transporter permease [Thermomicrobiales bacterium]|nr:amino acid ABC transporter permease [Thermomicrobiales bacterium]
MLPAINVDWSILVERIFSPDADFLRAMATTIVIAIVAQALGVLLGLASALAGMSRRPVLRAVSAAYVLVIRGTPLIVQIFFVFFGANLFFDFDLFPREVDLGAFAISGAIVAGIVALAINEGAYMSEIIRAGIVSVEAGQMEAALAVGMTRGLAMRRIVLPQAARVIVPPLGNEFNGMIKNTSLLAFIGVYEMFFDAEAHYSTTFKPVEYFLAVAFWYLVLTTIWSLIQGEIERRLDPAERAASPRLAGRLRLPQLARGR